MTRPAMDPETMLANHLDRLDPPDHVIAREEDQEAEARDISAECLDICRKLDEWEANDGAVAMARLRDDARAVLARIEKLTREVM